MNKYLKLALVAIAMFAASCGITQQNESKEERDLKAKNAELQASLAKIQEKEAADEKLGQYVLNMMAVSERSMGKEKHLSEGRKQVLARSIVKVADDVFENVDQRHAFVAVLAIESGFQKFAQSPTGPKGLAQVSKSAFKESMASCGIGNVSDVDVWNDDLNLYAGACYLRTQLELYNNDIFQAIVAYNQGPNSDAVKRYAKSGNLDEIEPLKYIAKFTYLNKNVTDKKVTGTPVVKDLGKNIKK